MRHKQEHRNTEHAEHAEDIDGTADQSKSNIYRSPRASSLTIYLSIYVSIYLSISISPLSIYGI